MKKLYLDDAATTAVYPAVLKAMLPYFTERFGNPSSGHGLGDEAANVLNYSRKKLAGVIGAKVHEVIFTSGTTESDNWAIQGLARAHKRKKIVVSAIEHAAVMECCNFMKTQGFEVVYVPVDSAGLIDFAFLEKHIDGALVVSVMHVNNVLGVVQDIARIGKLCRRKGVFFHTDASQSFAKEKIDVHAMNIDLLSASAHKIGGPKGVGLLYVRDGVRLSPLIFGGGQERGLRGGTENVPAVVGFAKAAEISSGTNKNKIRKVRDFMIDEIEKIGIVNGSKTYRIYNNIHFSVSADAEVLVSRLSEKGIYVSTGSACESKREKEDHVLKAIRLSDRDVRGSVRITLNDKISEKDARYVISAIKKCLKL